MTFIVDKGNNIMLDCKNGLYFRLHSFILRLGNKNVLFLNLLSTVLHWTINLRNFLLYKTIYNHITVLKETLIYFHLFSSFSPSDQTTFFANIVDPDEPSHQDLRCLLFCFHFWPRPLFGTIVLAKFKDGRSPLQNFRDEMVKIWRAIDEKVPSGISVEGRLSLHIRSVWWQSSVRRFAVKTQYYKFASCTQKLGHWVQTLDWPVRILYTYLPTCSSIDRTTTTLVEPIKHWINSHTVYWKSQFSILGMSSYNI